MEPLISFFSQISLDDIVSFVFEPEIKGVLLAIKIIFIIISSVFIGGILSFLTTTSWFIRRYSEDAVEFSSFKTFDARKAVKEWARIARRLKSPDYKGAASEAGRLLEEALKTKGYKGENIEDLLNQIDEKTIANISEAREACKIIDKPDLSLKEAEKAVEILEQAFEDLESF